MTRVIWRFLLVVAVCMTVLVPASRAGALPASIQPGDSITLGNAGCTLGFAATDATSTYFFTAAHCTDGDGQDVQLDDGTVFADAIAEGDPSDLPATADDWALLKVRDDYVSLVRGEVRGIAGTPVGYTTGSSVALGDFLRISGYGIPWFVDPVLRENRFGVVMTTDDETYTAIGLDTQGDSGGPIVHQATKRAYGLVSRLCLPLCTSEGPTMQGILAKSAAAGHPVTLLTN